MRWNALAKGRMLPACAAIACAVVSTRFFSVILFALDAIYAGIAHAQPSVLRWAFAGVLLAVHLCALLAGAQPLIGSWRLRESALVSFWGFAAIAGIMPGLPNPLAQCTWMTALYLASMGLLYAHRRAALAQAAREREDKARAEQHRQTDILARIEENHRRTRELWHDLNHHIGALTILHGQGRTEDVAAYLEQMRGELETVMMPARSGNTVVDAVLSEKLATARQDGIDVRLSLCPLTGLSHMHPVDLSALFANAMDNAIEACRRVKGERWIELRALAQEDALTLLFINPTNPAHDTGAQGLATSKGDTQAHGHGLRSIERSAARYGGNAVTGCREGKFTLAVYLPTDGDKAEAVVRTD